MRHSKEAWQEFARRMQARMDDLRLSQAELARRIWGTTQDSRGYTVAKNRDRISVWLNKGVVPDGENLTLLCEALEVEVGDLLPGSTHAAAHRYGRAGGFFMENDPNDEDKYRVRMDRVVSAATARKIWDLINEKADEENGEPV